MIFQHRGEAALRVHYRKKLQAFRKKTNQLFHTNPEPPREVKFKKTGHSYAISM